MTEVHECGQLRETMRRFLDGETDQSVCDQAAAHLEQCPQCLDEFEQEQHLKELVRRSCGCESAPAHLRNTVLERISMVTVTQESSRVLYSDGVSFTYVETHTTTVESWDN